MLNLVHILSGIALILFGVRFLRKGLDRIFGPRIERLIQHMGDHAAHAAATGFGLGLAIPSSTSMSSLLVEPLRPGRLTAKQVVPMALGANVGMTALVMLTTLPLDQATPFFILFGVILFQFTHLTRFRGVGQILLSLGFIFLGVSAIQLTSAVIAEAPDLLRLMQIAEHYPLALTMLAAILAIAMQSSTAAILLVMGIGASGSMGLRLVVPAVLGANLGIEATRLAVSWRFVEARRMAMIVVMAKALTAILVGLLLGLLVAGLDRIPVAFGFKVAMIHSGFNVLVAVVALPLTPALAWIARRLLPAPPASVEEIFRPRYIDDGPIESPSLALGQSLREILRAAELVRGMLDDSWHALETSNLDLAQSVSRQDDNVDLLDREIKRFLTRIVGQDLDPDSASEQMRQLRFISETEAIGDIVDKNLSELVVKKIRRELKFSEDDWRDLQSMFTKVRENMVIAETAFQSRNRTLAGQLLRHKEWLNNYQRRLADEHLARLNVGVRESHEISAIHLDVLASLKRINSCISHVAYAILLNTPQQPGDERSRPENLPQSVVLQPPVP